MLAACPRGDNTQRGPTVVKVKQQQAVKQRVKRSTPRLQETGFSFSLSYDHPHARVFILVSLAVTRSAAVLGRKQSRF